MTQKRPPERPQTGGLYSRNKDGSLKRIEGGEIAPPPAPLPESITTTTTAETE